MQSGHEENTPVEISLSGEERVDAPHDHPFSLDQLLSRITDENIHAELAAGPALGSEAW